MTLFSKRVEELISESGETVASLAEIGGINRSTLQRIKSGERLPTSEFFSNLSRALRLSPVEQDELAQLLEIARVGETVSYSRRQIFDLIEMISELTEYKIPFSKEVNRKSCDRENQPATEPIEICSDPMAVLNLIENSIDQELFSAPQPDLKLCIPHTESKVYDYIFQQMMGNKKKLNLADVLGFRQQAAADEPDQALAALRHLIALSLLENVNYRSCYYYFSPESPVWTPVTALFPYFILTSERVITISADFEQAVFYRGAAIIDVYRAEFDRLVAKSQSFIEESTDLFEVYTMEQIRQLKHVVEPLPCFAYYIDRELLEANMNKDFPYYQTLLEIAVNHYANIQRENPNIINVFSLKNLEQFMKDGRLNFPDEVYDVVKPADRLYLLRLVRDDLANNRRSYYAIDEEQIFMNGSTEFSNEQNLIRVILHYRKNNQLVFKAFEIYEPSVVAAFDDFFTNMIKSSYVLPKEQTLAELDRLMQQCEV
ncbi:MAG: helix-turn-helix transcriptional regulator [Acetobacterium sp.]|uniref:helix-turn-helix transcriptional regulator n=1 Tax=Acetobacterium sp. TaxID=1872094 RepID=UPI003242F8BA